MLTDHLCATAHEALVAAKERAERQETGRVPVQATATARRLPRLRLPVGRGRGGGRRRGGRQQPGALGRHGSLTEVLIAE